MTALSTLPGYHRDYQMLTSALFLEALHRQDHKNYYTEKDFPYIRFLCLQNFNICTVSNISDFTQLSKLVLANNAIERLTGLDQLINLEVLDVSFNKLQSLDGVEKLIKLTDLSANNNEIVDISGLLKMSQTYKDLIGLPQSSHPLQSLNLQNNSLPGPLKNTIRILYSFKSLCILILLNNEFSREYKVNLQIYRKETLAFLPSLKYLDFLVILPEERYKATDAYKTELITLEERQQLEQKAIYQAIQRSKQIRIDAAADCLGFDNLVDSELLVGEANEKIFLIPAVKMEAVGWFRTEAIYQLRNFAKIMRRRRILRQGEVCEFEEFYQVVIDDLASYYRMVLQDYYLQKDFILSGGLERRLEQRRAWEAPKHTANTMVEEDPPDVEYNDAENAAEADIQAPAPDVIEEEHEIEEDLYEREPIHQEEEQLEDSPDVEIEQERPKSFKDLVEDGPDLYVSDLMRKFDEFAPLLKPQDARPVEQQPAVPPRYVAAVYPSTLDHLMALLKSTKQLILARETEVQYEIQENLDTLSTSLYALQNKTAEVAQGCFQYFKALLNYLNEKTSDLLHKALELKLWKESQANATKEEAQDTIAEAVELTLQDQGVQQQQQQEVQNLLPAEMTPQVVALLKDKASIATAAMNAHEHKSSLIDVREDGLIASQKEAVDTAMKVIQGCELERIRRRVLEVEEWYLREKEFAEKAAL